MSVRMCVRWVLATAVGLMTSGSGRELALGAERSQPVVARVAMRLPDSNPATAPNPDKPEEKKGDATKGDIIEPGDLLTVLEEREGAYLIRTFEGRRGLVDIANVMELEQAAGLYDGLIQAQPKNGRLYTLRAAAHWAGGKHQEALADFDRALEAGYKQPHVFVTRGLIRSTQGEHAKAIEDYSQALQLDAKNEAAYLNRAASRVVTQDYEGAVKDYSEALGLNPKHASAFQQRALAWKMLGQTEQAIADFDQAIALDPKSAAAYLGRGYLRFQSENSEGAVADFSQVIELDPQSAEAYNNRGFNRRLLGNYAEALADFEKAVELSPRYALAHQNRAWVLSAAPDAQIRNGKQAIESATRACEIDEYKDLNDLKALAAAHAENKQFDLAIGWQEKVVEMADAADKEAETELLDAYRGKEPFRLKEAK